MVHSLGVKFVFQSTVRNECVYGLVVARRRNTQAHLRGRSGDRCFDKGMTGFQECLDGLKGDDRCMCWVD